MNLNESFVSLKELELCRVVEIVREISVSGLCSAVEIGAMLLIAIERIFNRSKDRLLLITVLTC
jgi:hypothetical protein